MEKHVMTMPLQEEELRKLKIGDVVYLTGHIFTSRDMGHLRLRSLAAEGKPLPKDFTGAAIFHAGPVCLKNDDGSWRLNVIGPTTSIRMEPHADFVGQLGAKAIIGKGGMSEETRLAVQRNKRVYFAAIGGAGAFYGNAIKSSECVAFPDLLSEAVYRLEIANFPLVVAVDADGKSIF